MDDDTLTTPLFHKRINLFGRYHFDLEQMGQTIDAVVKEP